MVLPLRAKLVSFALTLLSFLAGCVTDGGAKANSPVPAANSSAMPRSGDSMTIVREAKAYPIDVKLAQKKTGTGSQSDARRFDSGSTFTFLNNPS